MNALVRDLTLDEITAVSGACFITDQYNRECRGPLDADGQQVTRPEGNRDLDPPKPAGPRPVGPSIVRVGPSVNLTNSSQLGFGVNSTISPRNPGAGVLITIKF